MAPSTIPTAPPNLDTNSLVGIAVAIVGNIVISLALNLQKLAHKRLDNEKLQARFSKSASVTPVSDRPTTPTIPNGTNGYGEREPLLRSNSEPVKAIAIDVLEGVPEEDDEEDDGHYLKSKLWWLGFILMNVGEVGNFCSYAFAPASVVAPLGTFALVANCLFAPLILRERFRKLDLLGIAIAVIGAITVVLAATSSNPRLDPSGLVKALQRPAFLAYAIIYIVAGLLLTYLSQQDAGKKIVFIDVGLCALFGGFTVLSTKAFGTLLSLEWARTFTEWITYPVIIVLIGTGIGQVRYLNKALQRFDSKVVIPVQFVFFTISAIIGSATLYGDFDDSSLHQRIVFLYGCGATFIGVFILAWASQSISLGNDSADNQDSESLLPEDQRGIRRRATTMPTASSPIPRQLRKRRSGVGMGLSPARYTMLLHEETSRERRGPEEVPNAPRLQSISSLEVDN